MAHQFRRWWRRRQRGTAEEPQPPYRETGDGKPRRLGVEFEFSGLSLARLSELVPQATGGHSHVVSDYEAEVRDTPWGTFVIELDFAFPEGAWPQPGGPLGGAQQPGGIIGEPACRGCQAGGPV